MNSIEISRRMALTIVAAACLLISGALSMPMDRGMGMHGQGKMIFALNNVTSEELGNMTLGEIREREKIAQNCSPEGQNCIAGQDPRMPLNGQMNAAGDRNMAAGKPFFAGPSCYGFLASGSNALLLMDDVTVEELGEMSLNQILDLNEKKMQELDNMTLNDIRDLWQEKVEAQNNMTINELINESRDLQAKEGIINWVSIQYRRLVA